MLIAYTFQTGIEGSYATHTSLADSFLKLSQEENGEFHTVVEKDFDGNISSFTNESKALSRYEYDSLNRLTEVKLPPDAHSLGNSAQVTYDAEGRVAEVNRPGITKIHHSYDPVSGLLASQTYYHADGSPDYQLSLSYDAMGRVIQKRFKKLGVAAASSSVVYDIFYDGHQPNGGAQIAGELGFVTGIKGPLYTQTLKHAPDGSIQARETFVEGEKPIQEKMTTYSDGTLATWTIEQEGREKTEFTYLKDSLGRLGTLQLGQTTIAQVKYNALQKIDSIQFSDQQDHLDYDPTTGNLLGVGLNRWDFNNRGLLSHESQDVSNPSANKVYQYSDSRELTSEKQGNVENNYSYSATGLMTGFAEGEMESKFHLIALPHPAWERKTKEQASRYVLDPSGRVAQTPVGTLEYGAHGRLEYLQVGEKKITYSYDEKGVRLLKKVDDQLKEIYLGSFMVTEKGIVSPVRIGGRVVGVSIGNHFKRMHFDVRGTAVEDDSRAVSPITAYGSRSGQRISESSAIDYAMVGYDSDLQAYRMDARDYDPVLKRFLTPDPLFLEHPEKCIESPAECNLYGYAAGNPVSFVDPSGLAVLYGGMGASGGGGFNPPVEGKSANHSPGFIVEGSGGVAIGTQGSGFGVAGFATTGKGTESAGAVGGVGYVLGVAKGDISDLGGRDSGTTVNLGPVSLSWTTDKQGSLTSVEVGVGGHGWGLGVTKTETNTQVGGVTSDGDLFSAGPLTTPQETK